MRNDSDICNEYINFNKRSLEEVVNIMIEMNFYFTYTSYRGYCKSIRRNYSYKEYDDEDYGYYHYECSLDKYEISMKAKNIALNDYFYKFNSYDEAILDNRIPIILHDTVKNIMVEIIDKKIKEEEKKRIREENKLMNMEDKPKVNIVNKKVDNKNDLNKCLCNNIVSLICGFCSRCCSLENCKKHTKNYFL